MTPSHFHDLGSPVFHSTYLQSLRFDWLAVGKGTIMGRCVWKTKYFRDRRWSQKWPKQPGDFIKCCYKKLNWYKSKLKKGPFDITAPFNNRRPPLNQHLSSTPRVARNPGSLFRALLVLRISRGHFFPQGFLSRHASERKTSRALFLATISLKQTFITTTNYYPYPVKIMNIKLKRHDGFRFLRGRRMSVISCHSTRS